MERQRIPYPAGVGARVDRYLRLVDGAIPGRIEGLYLAGSVALGDYRPGASDVDFVAIVRDALASSALDRLEEAHAAMRGDGEPWFDGIYVTWDDLTRNPVMIETVPFSLEGVFRRDGGKSEANPSVWLTLRRHPFAVRGPREPDVWYDPAAIRQWNAGNLGSYWRNFADRLERAPAITDDRTMDWLTVWCVPGVARLHYTIAELDVVSKTAACAYALARFPERWHTVIQEAQTIRAGGQAPTRGREERRRDVLAFMRFVIGDALAP